MLDGRIAKHRSENNCLDSIVAITLRRDVPQEMLDSYFPNDAKSPGLQDICASALRSPGKKNFWIKCTIMSL